MWWSASFNIEKAKVAGKFIDNCVISKLDHMVVVHTSVPWILTVLFPEVCGDNEEAASFGESFVQSE